MTPFRTVLKLEYRWLYGCVEDDGSCADEEIDTQVNKHVDAGWELMEWKPAGADGGIYALMRREKR